MNISQLNLRSEKFDDNDDDDDDDDDDDNLFSIPEIHQSGYRTSHYITMGIVQNESLQ